MIDDAEETADEDIIRFDAEGVEIPFPHRTVVFKNSGGEKIQYAQPKPNP